MAAKKDKPTNVRVQLARNIAGLGNDGEVVTVHNGQAELLVDKEFATYVVDDDTAVADDEDDDADEGKTPARRAR